MNTRRPDHLSADDFEEMLTQLGGGQALREED